jgi:hypothetical protein
MLKAKRIQDSGAQRIDHFGVTSSIDVEDVFPVVLVCMIGLVTGLPWWRQVIFDFLLWLFYCVLGKR